MHVHDDELSAMKSHRREPRVEKPSVRGPADPSPAGLLSLQRRVGNAAVARMVDDSDERSPVHDVVGSGSGRPLDASTRASMESSFGQDFGNVRIHTGSEAADSCRSVQASAYTVGRDIVLGAGGSDLSGAGLQRTLAHELTHVVQQRSGPVDGSPAPGGIRVSDPSDRFEQEAERTADQVMAGGAQTALQRQDEEDEEDEEG